MKKLDQNKLFSEQQNERSLKQQTKLTFTLTDSSDDKSSSAILENALAEKCEVDISNFD